MCRCCFLNSRVIIYFDCIFTAFIPPKSSYWLIQSGLLDQPIKVYMFYNVRWINLFKNDPRLVNDEVNLLIVSMQVCAWKIDHPLYSLGQNRCKIPISEPWVCRFFICDLNDGQWERVLAVTCQQHYIYPNAWKRYWLDEAQGRLLWTRMRLLCCLPGRRLDTGLSGFEEALTKQR